MFTGLIDHYGEIIEVESIPNGQKILIKHSFLDLSLGESISIDGICLTVTHFSNNQFACDISPETLKITTAQHFKKGQLVNLERALLPSSRLGGHFVTGHVDQTLNVSSISQHNEFIEISFHGLDSLNKRLIVKKGSIAINGVSLTINDLCEDGFKVMLIPHTLERTNLKNLRENDAVNVEFDILARMLARQFESIHKNCNL